MMLTRDRLASAVTGTRTPACFLPFTRWAALLSLSGLAALTVAGPLRTGSACAAPSDCPPGVPCQPEPSTVDDATGTIGESVQGKPILAYRFGNGTSIRAVVAGIHGGYEWNTVALAEALIEHLTDHPEEVPRQTTLWIVPALNVDGYARGHNRDGRANARGVDLNRNFPALWQAEWPRAGCWDLGPITAGEAPASEPETLAMMEFLLGEHVEALVSYHSAALGIYAGGQPVDPRSEHLAKTLSAASGYRYPPRDLGCRYTGQLIDWAAANGITAVDVELPTRHGKDFEENLALLRAFLEWSPSTAASDPSS